MTTTLHLDDDESQLLRLVLKSRISGLETEIAHTDSREFREHLHRQLHQLGAILAKLPIVPRPSESTGYRA